jgi:hypothetical protein
MEGSPVRDSRPPPALVRAVNPLVRLWIATPLSRLLGRRLAILRFDGRKSGRSYAIVVGIHDGDSAVFTPAAWRHNFRGGAPVRVTCRGAAWQATGRLVEDPAEVATALQQAIDAGSPANLLGLKVEKGHRITADDARGVRSLIRLSAA